MTITKINELTKLCLGPFDYYYHCNEVDELVNDLQSKTIKWRNDMPTWGKVILLVNLEKGWQDIVFVNKTRNCLTGLGEYPPEITKSMKWCYMDDLLKTIPQDK